MRILYVVSQAPSGSTADDEHIVLNLAQAAQADASWAEVLAVGHNPDTVWRAGGGGLRPAVVDGVPVTTLGAPATPRAGLDLEADSALRDATERFLAARAPFDVVHVLDAFRTLGVVEAIAARRIPYVVTVTGFFGLHHRIGPMDVHDQPPQASLPAQVYGEPNDRCLALLRGASAVTTASDYLATIVKREYPELNLFVIPNGVDLLRFNPRVPPPPRPLTIGYLGAISQAKGALLLARAFGGAAAPGAQLRMAGACPEPETAAEIAALGATAAIQLENAVSAAERPGRLAEFDILAIPDQVPEPFCLSLYEGFAAGLPALVSDLGQIGEVVRSTGAGMVLPPADETAWSNAIEAVVQQPQQLATWAAAAPLPWRIEEETFLHLQIYRAAAGVARS